MKRKQGESDEDAQRCPSHPAFVLGLCFLCGAKKEDAEGGAPGVAVGHETLKQGGDGDGNYDEARCVKEEDTEGGAPGAAVGHGIMKEEGDDHGNPAAARCPPRPEVVLGLACPRPESVLGLAYPCRAKEEDAGGSASGATVANIHQAPVLPGRAAPATSTAGASDLATLFRERKLILVLDLDRTLLNSTRFEDLSASERYNGFRPDTGDKPHMDLFRLDSDKLGMLTKLRPFVRGFLEQASSMFEMYVYTVGNQVYAKAAVDLLDPNGVYSGDRVVSRDESIQAGTKSLDDIPGANPVATVILDALDDKDVAWPGHQDNLILTDRYRYFASTCRKSRHDIPSLAEQGRFRDEIGEHGGSLAVALGVLKRVCRAFFEGPRKDVREVIAEMRGQVLQGCTVAFSYLEQRMEDSPDDTRLWTLAERLGAVCRKDVDETVVTHVVAEDPGTHKALWARDHRKLCSSTRSGSRRRVSGWSGKTRKSSQ